MRLKLLYYKARMIADCNVQPHCLANGHVDSGALR